MNLSDHDAEARALAERVAREIQRTAILNRGMSYEDMAAAILPLALGKVRGEALADATLMSQEDFEAEVEREYQRTKLAAAIQQAKAERESQDNPNGERR